MVNLITAVEPVGVVILRKIGVATCLLLLAGLLISSRSPNLLERIQQQGYLEFLSANDPNTLTQDAQGVAGIEFELMQRFAKQLGVAILITQPGDRQTLNYQLQHNPLTIAASGIQVSSQLADKISFGPSYMTTATLVIGQTGKTLPARVEDLVGRQILVKSGSYQADLLRHLQKELPALTWEEAELDMQDLQERVHSGKVELALIERDCYEQNKALYTQAQVAFTPISEEHLAWAFGHRPDNSLRDAATTFFNELHQSGKLHDIRTRYSTASIEPDHAITQFNEFTEQRLPRWEATLRMAAEQNDLDWTALAGVGYQESKWDASAVSETGVKGFMMLTSAAAKDVDILNLLDAKQSIVGGARYLRMLLDKLPEELAPEDRLAFALAAYNIGYQHLEDARQLTSNSGKNPNRWEDVKTEMPHLGQKRFYKNLKAGYARGRGAVIYVENVLTFRSLLLLREQEATRRLLASNVKPVTSNGIDVSPEITAALQQLSAIKSL